MRKSKKNCKRLVIEYEDDGNNINNAALVEGTQIELIRVLSCGGPDLSDAAINGTLNFYLRVSSREAFLARFFSEVDNADRTLEREMRGGQQVKS